MSTTEQNKAQSARWFEEVWAKRRAAAIFEMAGPDAVAHTEQGRVVGPEPFSRFHQSILAAFPDLELAVEAVIGEGDLVAIRWVLSATHLGEYLGVAATGRRVQVRGTTWHRHGGGRLVEGWDTWNSDGLLRQLQ